MFFASVMGEALCDKLNIKVHIANDALRLFKYNGINLIERARVYLENSCLDEAFIDTFNLVDNFKYLINTMK